MVYDQIRVSKKKILDLDSRCKDEKSDKKYVNGIFDTLIASDEALAKFFPIGTDDKRLELKKDFQNTEEYQVMNGKNEMLILFLIFLSNDYAKQISIVPCNR